MASREPQDPMIRNLVNMIRGQQMNRRSLLRGAAVGAASLGALSLAGCSSEQRGKDYIIFGNWTLYIDYVEETGEFPTLEAFQEQAGFEVRYREEIDDNNSFYGKIKDQLELGTDIGFDVINTTDWLNARMIGLGYLQEYDYNNLPNVTKNLVDQQWNALDVDPGRKHSIPWQLPASGFVWNVEEVPGGIRTLDDFMRPEFKGKVGVLSEMRDTVGIILAAQGVDPASAWGDTEFDKAMEWLDDGIQSGQIGQVKGNSYTQDLQRGDTLVAMAWTGDIAMMVEDYGPQWELGMPDSGGMIAADSLTVPQAVTPEAKAKVEEMIDYYYDPMVQALVADYVNFVPPVKGTQEAMRSLGLENSENPLIFPDEEMSSKLLTFRTLTAEEELRYETSFQKVMGL